MNAIAKYFIIGLLVVSCEVAVSKIVDSVDNPDSLLLGVAPGLDSKGIDVLLGQAAQHPPPERPRLALLNGFAANGNNWGEFLPSTWATAFSNGVVGVLLAIESDKTPEGIKKKATECKKSLPENDAHTCSFVEQWLRADPKKRVFVAFTRSDIGAAREVALELERQGFVVFTYLNNATGQTWADPHMVGEAFASSGRRYVIDSPASRGSEGVKFEAKMCVYLLTPPPKPEATDWFAKFRATKQ